MSSHPQHIGGLRPTRRNRPVGVRDLLARWVKVRRCHRAGGHWWHPMGEIDWFCCQCPAQADGMPRDGTRQLGEWV